MVDCLTGHPRDNLLFHVLHFVTCCSRILSSQKQQPYFKGEITINILSGTIIKLFVLHTTLIVESCGTPMLNGGSLYVHHAMDAP